MKKFFTLSFFALCAKLSLAQKLWDREFKPFKIDFNAGYGILKNVTDQKAGLSFSIEPHYAFTGDAFTFGFRMEGMMVKFQNADKVDQSETDLSGILTCDYYFNNNNFRPFIGAGAGVYDMAEVPSQDEGALFPEVTLTNHAGGMFRAGGEWGHLRTSVEYNLISGGPVKGYFGVKVGIALGGGRMGLISGNDTPY